MSTLEIRDLKVSVKLPDGELKPILAGVDLTVKAGETHAIMGPNGTGKSTLLETLAMQDIARGRGMMLIDPHGDLAERIARSVPEDRRQDVAYERQAIDEFCTIEVGDHWEIRTWRSNPHVWIELREVECFRRSCARGVTLGFQGRMCIHPDQVPIANAAYSPTKAEVARARRIAAALEQGWEPASRRGDPPVEALAYHYAAAAEQAKAVGVTIVWTAVVAFIAFKVVDLLIGLRVTEEQEREGLDITSHGETAYHY